MVDRLDADLHQCVMASLPGLTISRATVVRDWSESLVYRLEGNANGASAVYYLKRLDHQSARERTIYDLASQVEGFPAPKGRVLDIADTSWLLLESVAGESLAKCGKASIWSEAVRQLARFHDEGTGRPWAALAAGLPTVETLVGDLVPGVLTKTHELCQDGTYCGVDMALLDQVGDNLAECWPSLKSRLLGYPRTLVHGDCHEGNLFWAEAQGIVMIDWSSAFLGPGLFDLVSLIDVSERMGHNACQPEQLQDAYWYALKDQTRKTYASHDTARSAVTILRSLLELQWFNHTDEDYGQRANRELAIIQKQLFNSKV